LKWPAFDFVPDPSGPRGIAVASWLERERLAQMVIDAQNYITLPEYSGAWTGENAYYYRRLSEVVLPNIQRLLSAFRRLGCLVVYTRIAALNENLRDVPGLARKVLAEELRDARGRPYHPLAGERASQID
jgi:nicotinamidase-related amidase